MVASPMDWEPGRQPLAMYIWLVLSCSSVLCMACVLSVRPLARAVASGPALRLCCTVRYACTFW